MDNVKILVLFVIISCASYQTDSAFNKTQNMIYLARQECLKNIKNELLAKKECFPTLTNKKLLVQLNGVDDLVIQVNHDKVRLYGKSASSIGIYCELNKDQAAYYTKSPEQLIIGDKYWVEGDFSAFSSSSILDFYTLSDCKISKYIEKSN